MAITHEVYWKYKQSLLNQSPAPPDLDADTIKVALLKNTHTPDIAGDQFWSDVSADEVATGAGYTAGGAALTTKAVGIDGTGGFAYFTAANTSWPSFTHSGIRYAVIYKDTGTPATSPLMTLVDFGGDEGITGGTFSLIYPAAASGGILEVV
jgi:hypothetical protein